MPSFWDSLTVPLFSFFIFLLFYSRLEDYGLKASITKTITRIMQRSVMIRGVLRCYVAINIMDPNARTMPRACFNEIGSFKKIIANTIAITG